MLSCTWGQTHALAKAEERLEGISSKKTWDPWLTARQETSL